MSTNATKPESLARKATSARRSPLGLRRQPRFRRRRLRTALDSRLPSEQSRGLRGTEREGSKLLEHAGVSGKVLLAFQANAPVGAAQVHDSEPWHLQELEDG